MDQIINVFNQLLPISSKETERLNAVLKPLSIKKGTYILTAGEVCKSLTFIKSGSVRSIHTNEKGESYNLMLNAENDFVSNYESFISYTPSNISIQAIENCELLLISKTDLDALLNGSLYWNSCGRLLMEMIFILTKKRLESLLYKTPQERYLYILENESHLLERYSLLDLASFIGIKPQSLSRIRAKLKSN